MASSSAHADATGVADSNNRSLNGRNFAGSAIASAVRRWRLGLALVLGLLVACTSGPSGEADTLPARSDPEAEQNADDASPLAGYLGLSRSEDFAEAFQLQRAEVIEAEIDSCMGRLGFDYERYPVSAETVFDTVFGAELHPLTYAQTYGLSVSTLFEEALYEPGIETVPEGEDPNAEILSVLSPAEVDVWFAALRGREVLFDPATGIAYDPRTGDAVTDSGSLGCVGEAQDAFDDEFEGLIGLLPHLEELEARVESDDRVVQAQSGWSSCMAEKGYSFETRQDMWTDASRDFQPLQNEILAALQGGNNVVIEITDDASHTPIPPHLIARLDEHKEREIATAVASYECDIGIDEIRSEVRAEFERIFIDDNREFLDALDIAGG